VPKHIDQSIGRSVNAGAESAEHLSIKIINTTGKSRGTSAVM